MLHDSQRRPCAQPTLVAALALVCHRRMRCRRLRQGGWRARARADGPDDGQRPRRSSRARAFRGSCRAPLRAARCGSSSRTAAKTAIPRYEHGSSPTSRPARPTSAGSAPARSTTSACPFDALHAPLLIDSFALRARRAREPAGGRDARRAEAARRRRPRHPAGPDAQAARRFAPRPPGGLPRQDDRAQDSQVAEQTLRALGARGEPIRPGEIDGSTASSSSSARSMATATTRSPCT